MRKLIIATVVTFASLSSTLAAPGDASRGQQDFRACAPCHSLEPDRNMTGPSLAKLWGRKVGSLPSFERYSDALKSSRIIWDDRVRADLLTFLKRGRQVRSAAADGATMHRARAYWYAARLDR